MSDYVEAISATIRMNEQLDSDTSDLKDEDEEILEEVEQVDKVRYVGNTSTKVYHKPDCSMVIRMNEDYKIVSSSKDVFIKKGYRACEYCKPLD
ncbi:Ada metal-binding domain-containing protein [Butyrivibrio sp. INlla16]|uniref:Ada metal-binding domain-containing protein n=1 Tax=Butyrivibrio sp. INlla16 TaxID=1520807 RepID=UPI00147EB363|nr:Ada metal-binding domain-containing protein [Butyrivibrio sp. INlla16]